VPVNRIRDDLRRLFNAAEGELSAATAADLPEPDNGDDQGAAALEAAAIRRKLTALNSQLRELILAQLRKDFTAIRCRLHGRCAAVQMTDVIAERVMETVAFVVRRLGRWHVVPEWAPAYNPERHQRDALDLRALSLRVGPTIAGDLKVIEEREASFLRTLPTPANVAESDSAAYVPARDVLHESSIQSYPELHRILRENPGIGTRKPTANRLEIHAGDWLRYRARLRRQDELAVDAAAEKVAEVEREKEAIRRQKEQGGQPA
jgi:hypothetical protein